jgi:hypothetical protein
LFFVFYNFFQFFTIIIYIFFLFNFFTWSHCIVPNAIALHNDSLITINWSHCIVQNVERRQNDWVIGVTWLEGYAKIYRLAYFLVFGNILYFFLSISKYVRSVTLYVRENSFSLLGG